MPWLRSDSTGRARKQNKRREGGDNSEILFYSRSRNQSVSFKTLPAGRRIQERGKPLKKIHTGRWLQRKGNGGHFKGGEHVGVLGNRAPQSWLHTSKYLAYKLSKYTSHSVDSHLSYCSWECCLTYNNKLDPAASYEVYGESGDSEEHRNLHNFEKLIGRSNWFTSQASTSISTRYSTKVSCYRL